MLPTIPEDNISFSSSAVNFNYGNQIENTSTYQNNLTKKISEAFKLSNLKDQLCKIKIILMSNFCS